MQRRSLEIMPDPSHPVGMDILPIIALMDARTTTEPPPPRRPPRRPARPHGRAAASAEQVAVRERDPLDRRRGDRLAVERHRVGARVDAHRRRCARCAPCPRRSARGSPRPARAAAWSAAPRPSPRRPGTRARAAPPPRPRAPDLPPHGHRLGEHRRRVAVARGAPGRDPALEHELGPHAGELRPPEHGVGELADLERADVAREPVRDRRVDRDLGEVAQHALVVAGPVLGRRATRFIASAFWSARR